MSLFWKRDKPSIDRREALRGVPVLPEHVSIEMCDGQPHRLRSTQARGTGFMERFRPPRIERAFELDAFGAFVIAEIDGTRTVMEVVQRFRRHFGTSRREAELGVVAFIKMLLKRNLVAVVVARDASHASSAEQAGP